MTRGESNPRLRDYLRVEKVIHYLEQHFKLQPSLEDLARCVDLSPFHFQRLFKRWAGISPKRFLEFLTIEYAKKLLEEPNSVLDVTYASGLSGPGRLHDLFVNVQAVTPGEFKRKGSGLRIEYGIHPGPFGDSFIAVTGRGVCGLSFLAGTGDAGRQDAVENLRRRWQGAHVKENPGATKPYMDRIFPSESKNGGPAIGVFIKGTNFQLRVWEALLRIPAGFVCSYEDVARYLGKPDAMRAVGRAVGANPIAYIIPCHRVIRKTGALGGYRYGSARKKALIGWEMARREPRRDAQREAL
jgi:AraC family transcriptional regulator of adaptative response/methylated-DNA-[protein]-cysteine methyltransferase